MSFSDLKNNLEDVRGKILTSSGFLGKLHNFFTRYNKTITDFSIALDGLASDFYSLMLEDPGSL